MLFGRMKTSAPKTGTTASIASRRKLNKPFGVVAAPRTLPDRPIRVAGEGVQPPRSNRKSFFPKSYF